MCIAYFALGIQSVVIYALDPKAKYLFKFLMEMTHVQLCIVIFI